MRRVKQLPRGPKQPKASRLPQSPRAKPGRPGQRAPVVGAPSRPSGRLGRRPPEEYYGHPFPDREYLYEPVPLSEQDPALQQPTFQDTVESRLASLDSAPYTAEQARQLQQMPGFRFV